MTWRRPEPAAARGAEPAAAAADADDARAARRAEEAALVRAAQAGDRAAFGRLYERYARVVHGLLLARVRAASAEDLVQDVFVQALQRLADLRDPQAFPGWLAAIARRRALDHHRRERPLDELPGDMPATPDGAEEAARVLSLLRTLPAAYRETLVLRLVEGLSGPEIAERTGLTEGSVRVNLHRGVRLLRERLGVEERG
uniref:Sigma-70 family RNA polymerase sigma factor n=1 Tax=Eiseniibacteriota bacterium TaxID=2212470 RepID=A0A832MKH3_UNCEI